MKLLVLLEVDVSKTIAETMQRNGFTVAQDGSHMQIKVPNTPAIPQRKTKIVFITDPRQPIESAAILCHEPSAVADDVKK